MGNAYRPYFIFGAIAAVCAVPAFAQNANSPASAQTQASGVISYPPEFFNEFRPNSARDMVQRIPGFSFDEGNSNVRGFAGSTGNVLIDGALPSTKSISLGDLLGRIAPESVLRIDLIRGGAAGIDMQGQSVVANVIRKDETSISGSVTLGVGLYGGSIGRDIEADMTRRSNTLTVGANLEITNEKEDNSTARIIRRNAAGAIRDSGPQSADNFTREYNGAVTIESQHGPGIVIANVGVQLSKDNERNTTVRTTPAGVTTTSLSTDVGKRDEFEASLDYDREIGAIRLHALALKNYQISTDFSQSIEASGISTSNRRTTSGESILRATVAADYAEWLTLETGGEGAINNRYQQQTQIIGGSVFIIPNSNIRVEETRAELFGTANVRFWPGLRGEFGVRYEASTIQQRGDTNKEKFFSFVKPRAIFTYDATDTTQLRFRVEREVGQLDFGSFTASSNFVEGTVTAGNPDLEPERAWVYEAVLEQRFWEKGAFTATYTHSEVEAINDRILIVGPTGALFDAPGNIGRGTRDRIELSLSLPLDYFGLEGGMLKPDVTFRDSKVTDPVTGITRRSTGETMISTGFEYTQDIEALDSTMTISGRWDSPRWSYRLRELTHEGHDFQFEFQWDWKIRPDLLFQFSAESFIPGDRFRERTMFTGSRAGAISGFESLLTPDEAKVEFSLRKSF